MTIVCPCPAPEGSGSANHRPTKGIELTRRAVSCDLTGWSPQSMRRIMAASKSSARACKASMWGAQKKASMGASVSLYGSSLIGRASAWAPRRAELYVSCTARCLRQTRAVRLEHAPRTSAHALTPMRMHNGDTGLLWLRHPDSLVLLESIPGSRKCTQPARTSKKPCPLRAPAGAAAMCSFGADGRRLQAHAAHVPRPSRGQTCLKALAALVSC